MPLDWEEDMQTQSEFLDKKVHHIYCFYTYRKYSFLLKMGFYPLNRTEVYILLWQEELKADHASYLKEHPEVRALLSDFMQFLLLRKPDDVFQSAREYFGPFASSHPPESNVTVESSWKHSKQHIILSWRLSFYYLISIYHLQFCLFVHINNTS